MSYRILSFDGGGYRGLFTSRVLARIQAAAGGVIHRANMLAGVSTGGLIALGLAKGLSPSQLVALYIASGRRIFHDSLADNVADLGNLIGAQYGLDGLREVAEETFGAGTTLGDLADKSGKAILIGSFGLDLETTIADVAERPVTVRMARPKMFSSFDPKDRDLFAVDIALATCAVPTYFPARHGYIDGGIVATNPVLFAVTEALTRAHQVTLPEVQVLALGTGLNPTRVAGAHEKRELDWGIQQWAPILPQLIIDGQAFAIDHVARAMLGDQYHRVDALVAVKMDDFGNDATDALVSRANTLELADTVSWLVSKEWGAPRPEA